MLELGLPDEMRAVVGSHSGVGVFDASTGAGTLRVHDDDYIWFDPKRMAILVPDGLGSFEAISSMGLEGGVLPDTTPDGWRCERTDNGALLVRDEKRVEVVDDEEFRACGWEARPVRS